MPCMRICLATRRYPVVTETFVDDSAGALRLGGHDVSILSRGSSSWPGRASAVARHPGEWIHGCLRARRLVRSRIAATWDAAYRARLDAVLDSDCVLAHFGYVALDWLPVAVLARRRFAAYFHGSDITRWLRRDPRMYDGLFASAAGLLTNSQFLRTRLVAAGADPLRVRVVPLSPNAAFASSGLPPLSSPSIITVARLVEKKGLDDAIVAFAEACRTIPAMWRYRIIGDGPDRRRLRQLARRAGVDDRLDFVPRATRDEVRQALNESSIYVQSSRTASNGDTEGTPVSLIEAAAVGLPVVATAHAGIPELLPPDSTALGWLVPERSIDGLSAAIVRLASDHEKRRAWGRACMELARARTPERESRDLTDALEALARVPA
jgi:colanic acid/amylovoran biosynthesis glycosyltransferase